MPRLSATYLLSAASRIRRGDFWPREASPGKSTVTGSGKFIKPGRYRYMDVPHSDPVIVVVMVEDGILVARFPAAEGDDGADVPVAVMWGHFQPVT